MRQLVEDHVAGRLPSPPVCAALGMTMARVGEGTGEMEYVADGRHANAMGTLHGGILCDIADGAMGIAMASVLDEGTTFTTLELKINFLRPVWNAKLTGKARIVSRGRSVVVTACDVFDDKDRHVASVTATQMLLAGDAAKGR